MELQVVGGGLGGLVAAVTAAELGAKVRLHEAHAELGGRARTTGGAYVAHEGPHVVYRDGPLWGWLRERDLLPPSCPVPARELTRFFFRRSGRRVRNPGLGLLRVSLHRGRAPVEESFVTWATRRFGDRAAHEAAAASAVVTYHHDPGSLSARFVHDRLRRAYDPATQATYILGGWGHLVAALTRAARERGVTIETGSRVTRLPGGGPAVVATSLAAARTLLGDDSLRTETGTAALLDVGVTAHGGDAFIVSDLDVGGWLERFSAADPSLSPAGTSLVQVQVPVPPGSSSAAGVVATEALLDLGVPGWRGRTTWRRDAVARGRTGAVDLPGATWRDRPAVRRGDDVYLVGDQVAAPGLLSEVSFASAVQAADLAVRSAGRRSTAR